MTQPRQTRCLILVMVDGVRWQEVFRGASADHLGKGGQASPSEWASHDPSERRRALMPWVWTHLASRGQLLGNQDKGNRIRVTNGINLSYPGYGETLCGFPIPGLRGNEERVNPIPSALERIHRLPAFRGRVAAFATWRHFAWILRKSTCGFPVISGDDPVPEEGMPPMTSEVNRRKREERPRFPTGPADELTVEGAVAYLIAAKPRLLLVVLDEPDEWAHRGDYPSYLHAIQATDRTLRRLWETANSIPGFEGKTTLLVTTDHGRGGTVTNWKDHGGMKEAEDTWLLAMGPDTPGGGEAGSEGHATNGQVAATVAELCGVTYRRIEPCAAQPIERLLTP